MKRICLLALVTSRFVFGWGCEGHQAVALIAEANLNPRAAAQVQALLTNDPIDPALIRYCTYGRENLMADASTWPDDVRNTAGTGKWHYMDIPRQVSSGNIDKYCEPVSGPNAKGERGGCVISAIEYNAALLRNSGAPASERARALRYVIHFVGDLHQPLHTTDNHDQGGNCAPVTIAGAITITNLHSAWDSGLLAEELASRHERAPEYARTLERRFEARKAAWMGPVSLDSWAWESHAVGVAVTYGALNPPIPEEPIAERTDCSAENAKVYMLHIQLGKEYAAKAAPVIDEQIAKAGFRLARLLNDIWP